MPNFVLLDKSTQLFQLGRWTSRGDLEKIRGVDWSGNSRLPNFVHTCCAETEIPSLFGHIRDHFREEALPYMHIRYVPRERPPISSPRFLLQSISFSQMTPPPPQKKKKKKTPLRSITNLHFCRSGDHHFQNFFTFNPSIAAHGRLTTGSPNALPSAGQRPGPGVSGQLECQPHASYKSSPETPISRSNPLQSPAFSRSS